MPGLSEQRKLSLEPGEEGKERRREWGQLDDRPFVLVRRARQYTVRRTSSSAVLEDPINFSSSPTRLSISAMSLTSAFLGGSVCLGAGSDFSGSFASDALMISTSSVSDSPRTTLTSLLRPSRALLIFSIRRLTSTMPRISSPGSAWPVSFSLRRSGFVGSDSSSSSAATSDWRRRRRCDKGRGPWVGDGGPDGSLLVGDGG